MAHSSRRKSFLLVPFYQWVSIEIATEQRKRVPTRQKLKYNIANIIRIESREQRIENYSLWHTEKVDIIANMIWYHTHKQTDRQTLLDAMCSRNSHTINQNQCTAKLYW